MTQIRNITAGFDFTFEFAIHNYPSPQYTAHLSFRGQDTYDFVGTASGNTQTFTGVIESPGDYRWSLYCLHTTNGGKSLIDTGRTEVAIDPTSDSASDTSTHASRVLEAIEAVLEKRATSDQMSYSIAGRSLSKTPIADLIMMRDRYRAELKAEKGQQPKRFVARFV